MHKNFRPLISGLNISLFILFLFTFSLSSLSNENDYSRDNQEHYDSNKVDDQSNDVDTDEDESLEEQLKRIQIQNSNFVKQAKQMQESGSIDTGKLLEIFGSKSKQNSTSTTGGSGKISDQMYLIMEPFRTLSRSDVMTNIRGTIESTPAGVYVNKYPQIYEFIVDVLRSNDAMRSFARIADDKKKLTIFFILNVTVFIIAFILKRIGRNKRINFLKRVRLFVFIFTVRMGLFIGFFHNEVGPIWNLFKSNFL